jgi:hypothetical protein
MYLNFPNDKLYNKVHQSVPITVKEHKTRLACYTILQTQQTRRTTKAKARPSASHTDTRLKQISDNGTEPRADDGQRVGEEGLLKRRASRRISNRLFSRYRLLGRCGVSVGRRGGLCLVYAPAHVHVVGGGWSPHGGHQRRLHGLCTR